MGDMADYLIEQGEDELNAHDAGMCEGPCPYCEEEYRARAARQSTKKRPSRKGK